MPHGTPHSANDDPRRLRELVSRAGILASDHAIPTVVVGLAGGEGELLMPELIGFVESALRVEDAIFRMTRERAVLFLADVDRSRAEQIVTRLVEGFCERFPAAREPGLRLGYFELPAGARGVTAKEILPAVFATDPVACAS